MSNRTFVLGDVHGAFLALQQVLERSGFNKSTDTLVCLGDVCDGWPFVDKCFDELITIKNLIYIMGNHDWWAWKHFKNERPAISGEAIWTTQGGDATLQSYKDGMPKAHLDILDNAHAAMHDTIDGKSTVFVHGGIWPDVPFEQQVLSHCIWDRDMLSTARRLHIHNQKHNMKSIKIGGYDQIFVGHTTTQQFDTFKPVNFCNVWDIDTGAGWDGVLTIMDVVKKEYLQSDNVLDLMPNIQGRKLRFK